MIGIPIQKLRRWDEQGVLTATRSHGGHRRYDRALGLAQRYGGRYARAVTNLPFQDFVLRALRSNRVVA